MAFNLKKDLNCKLINWGGNFPLKSSRNTQTFENGHEHLIKQKIIWFILKGFFW